MAFALDTVRVRPFEIAVYLENIAAGALGRMIPVNGARRRSDRGSVKVTRVGRETTCQGDFTARSMGEKAGVSVPAGAGRTITKGVKSVGSGVRRLFGGQD